ncbi:SOS response-associated peptidase [Rhodococcus aerolatus]
MCGRYVSTATAEDLATLFDVVLDAGDGSGVAPAPSWNVAPTDAVPVVLERPPHDGPDQPRRTLRTARWGLVPGWSKDRRGAARLINARSETVTEKPAFRRAAAARRCLLPADGYYEWQPTPEGKVPYFLHDPDGALLAMAGLYELWRDPERAEDDPERWVWTTTVITREATDLLGEIHDRTPVLVPPDARDAWLDCRSGDAATARALLEAMPAPHLAPRRVGAAVGNVGNDGPELVEPVPDGPGDEAPGPGEQLTL